MNYLKALLIKWKQLYKSLALCPWSWQENHTRTSRFSALEDDYEVTMSYPTTPQVLEEYIPQCCDVDRAMVVVRTEIDPGLEYQDAKDENPYETKLEKEDMGQAEPDSQKQVGGERIMELLKELESARKEKENDPIADVKPAKTDDISDSIGTTSPIGSK